MPESVPAATGTPDPPAARGRVSHDERGNAVWNWGHDVLETTTRMLKRLVVPGLALEEEPDKKAGELEVEQDRSRGYDPYGRGGSRGKRR